MEEAVFQVPMTSDSATSTPSHHRPMISRHKRRCKSVGASARNTSFVFPTQQYAEFGMFM